MAYRVHLLNSAEGDIEELILFVQDRYGEGVAEHAYRRLMDKLELLETQPHMGHLVKELLDAGYQDYRILVHDRHTKVLYRLDEQLKEIYIHLVFNSKQDFQTLLYKRIIRYT